MRVSSYTSCWLALVLALAACSSAGESEVPSESVVGVEQALTTITLSGRVTNAAGSGIAGVTVTLAGSANATRTTDSAGNYSFGGLATGSYSLRPTKPNCGFSPDVVNLNNQRTNRTQNFAATGNGCSAAPRAMLLIDARLYAQLGLELDTYRQLAAQRRGFAIDFRSVSGLDDWGYAQVKSYVAAAKAQNPGLEGVLYVGNVKLPSFYKVRNDVVLTRLFPAYLEDLDATFEKRRAPGTIDPSCEETNDPECVVGEPRLVPPHDLDYVTKGPSPDTELWASFMPVGVPGSANTYADFGAQLRPYLNKLASFYRGQLSSNRRLYFVSNDLGERPEWAFDAFGAANIDFYGKPGPNGETGDDCLVNGQNLCYTRWPTQNFPLAADFVAYFQTFPWVGENWQQSNVFIPHMNAALYDAVEVNTHASETWSIVDSTQARALTKAGLLVALSGCSVAGFAQPGSPSYVDTSVLAGENLAVSYLYGSSKALASLGDPNWRGHYANHPLVYRELKLNTASYLGTAHRTRMRENYARAGSSSYDLKEWASEMLLGDPFMDLR